MGRPASADDPLQTDEADEQRLVHLYEDLLAPQLRRASELHVSSRQLARRAELIAEEGDQAIAHYIDQDSGLSAGSDVRLSEPARVFKHSL